MGSARVRKESSTRRGKPQIDGVRGAALLGRDKGSCCVDTKYALSYNA